MSTKFCANALEWWLTQQGKFDGATVCTRQVIERCPVSGKELNGTDQFEITAWKVDGVPQPTDFEINQIIEDYNAYIEIEKTVEISKRKAINEKLNKLGLTEEDIKILFS